MMDLEEIRYLPVTYQIIGVLVVVFLLQLFVPGFTEAMLLSPGSIVAGGQLWGLLTNMFLHGGPVHLMFNCMALFFFGGLVENIVGRKQFIKIFLASGLFASAFYVVTSILILQDYTPALGASGAIFGIIGTATMLRPNTPVIMLFFPVPTKLWIMSVFFIIISLAWFGTGGGTGIAENAHLGGMLMGFFFGYRIKQEEEKDPEYEWRVLYT